MLFSSLILFTVIVYNSIFLIFVPFTHKKLSVPERNCLEMFHFKKSISRFSVHCIKFYSVPHLVLTHAANATLDWSGDLRSWRTRDYSKKPSSMVTTRCDEKNQAFLTMDCDCLQIPFTSPHSLSINESSGTSRRFVLRHMVADSL